MSGTTETAKMKILLKDPSSVTLTFNQGQPYMDYVNSFKMVVICVSFPMITTKIQQKVLLAQLNVSSYVFHITSSAY